MVKPILAVNFKAYYPHSFGGNAYRIALDAVRVWRETGVEVILAPPFTELRRILEAVSGTEVKVYAQHADPVEPGAVTGFIPLEGLKDAGIHGVILNHSEHKLRVSEVNYLVKKAKSLGLKTLVCADTPETGAAVAVLEPDMVAVEPPELIGTGVSVSRAKPEVVTNSVNMIRRVNEKVTVLTGAGISNGEDAYMAVKLGTMGVLVASGIVKAKDPYQVMKDMAEGMLKAL
ncbi:triose-phosphate isomerase [Desulfurococcus mucosus]|uniref:Triosephosphate isomerase n=1 Tax=Desulfurococcus mucosus (strain ATCC 35584 / DSM 2162 / JCM 9187 / O7/1) TaxID=765177 RepID=E8R769_DESM0|nr:triose-phosphate isomerase [Desulfurococcus mucosus]ADV65534.1 triosephosphate isomerase [Desulfurococcus mucosus DSM 2162]